MKAIFIITGLPNSGRQTFMNEAAKILIRTSNISFSRLLDEKMKLITPKNPTKKQIEFLTRFKSMFVYSTLITSDIIERIKKLDSPKIIFFIKTNIPEDITIIRRAFPNKVKVIYIDRNLNWTYINYLPEDFKYNYKINNRGSLEDFKVNIRKFIHKYVPSKLFHDVKTFDIIENE